MERRLFHLSDGRVRDDPGRVLWSSAATNWAGFHIERHRVSSGHERRLQWPTARLGLIVGGHLRMTENRSSGGIREFIAGPRSVTLWPTGHESSSLFWSGSAEIIDLELPASALTRLIDPEIGRVRLIAQMGVPAGHFASLLAAVASEIEAGCPSGRLYGESICVAIAAQIASRYADTAPKDMPAAALASKRLSKVLDFMQANLSNDIGIGELASIANLSPSYFVQVFRNAMGVSPHQYILRQRVNEAKRLLAKVDITIAEVALITGFASQSHFGETFRSLVGTTPKRFREAL